LAQARVAETEAVLKFVEFRVFAAARPKGLAGGLGSEVTLEQAVKAALPFVEKSFTDQPLIEARLRLTLGQSFWYLGKAQSAADQWQAARTLYTRHLGPGHPDTLRSMHNLANGYHALGRYAEALTLREEALALRRARLGPDHPDTLLSMWGVAESLAKLGRGAEAVPLIDDAVERAAGKVIDPRLLPGVMELRLRHFEKSRGAAGCRQTTEMWESLKRADADSLYNAARMRAVTAGVCRAADTSPAGAKQAVAEADRAVGWLKQAVAAGYKDAARLKRDRDLDALRGRADFARLVTTLEGTRD
jgi:tetratricopeptide (TPR) repeat protein